LGRHSGAPWTLYGFQRAAPPAAVNAYGCSAGSLPWQVPGRQPHSYFIRTGRDFLEPILFSPLSPLPYARFSIRLFSLNKYKGAGENSATLPACTHYSRRGPLLSASQPSACLEGRREGCRIEGLWCGDVRALRTNAHYQTLPRGMDVLRDSAPHALFLLLASGADRMPPFGLVRLRME